MALKRTANGQYIIKTKAEAVRALTMMENLKDEIAEIQKEQGIDEMMQDCTELKKAATQWCIANKTEVLEIKEIGKVAKMIRAVSGKRWIGTKDDMTDELDGAKPLRSLVSKEVWMQITKRVPDPEKIDQAVAEGVITAKKVAPAYVETTKAPYLGIYDA